MITEHSYHSTLYGKKTRTFDIQDLADLRELKQRFPAIQICMLQDGCTSFHSLAYIKKSLSKTKVRMQDGTVKTGFEYAKEHRNITKLFNPYIFRCDCLRGYPNTFKIEWQTKKERITATTENNLWFNVVQSKETANNEYAEYTIKPVKLIPLYPNYLRTDYSFHIINWSGGNLSTINTDNSGDFIKEFDVALFWNKSAFKEGLALPKNDTEETRPYLHLTLKNLREKPTLTKGHTDDLKIETSNIRVWLSRMTTQDGQPFNNMVTIEQQINGKWEIMTQYKALESA